MRKKNKINSLCIIFLGLIFLFPVAALAMSVDLPSADTWISLVKDQGVSVSLIVFGAWFFTTRFWPYYVKLNDKRVETFTRLSESHIKMETISLRIVDSMEKTNTILLGIEQNFDHKMNELVGHIKKDLTDIILTQNDRYSTLPDFISSEMKSALNKAQKTEDYENQRRR